MRGAEPAAKLLISIPWTSPFTEYPGVTPRRSDWALPRWRRIWHYFSNAWRIHRSDSTVIVVATASIEVFALCLLEFLTRRRIVVFDFLCPRSGLAIRIGRILLRRVDRWLVIRTGDAAMLQQLFGVARERCRFVPFPAAGMTTEGTRGDYIYAAGSAHRDWSTFLAAVDGIGVRVVAASRPRLENVPANVDAIDLTAPDEGRRLSREALLVVVPMVDTHLPSGPLIVVDALAAGKAVVASHVNGTRDYIEHGVNGWLVPPGDAAAMRRQLMALIGDTAVIDGISHAARRSVVTPMECLSRIRGEAGSTPRCGLFGRSRERSTE